MFTAGRTPTPIPYPRPNPTPNPNPDPNPNPSPYPKQVFTDGRTYTLRADSKVRISCSLARTLAPAPAPSPPRDAHGPSESSPGHSPWVAPPSGVLPHPIRRHKFAPTVDRPLHLRPAHSECRAPLLPHPCILSTRRAAGRAQQLERGLQPHWQAAPAAELSAESTIISTSDNCVCVNTLREYDLQIICKRKPKDLYILVYLYFMLLLPYLRPLAQDSGDSEGQIGRVSASSIGRTWLPCSGLRAPASPRDSRDHTRRHEETVTARRARLSYTARSDVVAREAGRCEFLFC